MASGMNWRTLMAWVALLMMALAAWIFYRMESWPERTAHQVQSAFAELVHVQPRITVHNRVFFEQSTSGMDLVVITRKTQVERESEHEWLGSTKRIKLRGVFEVKAGFDLTQGFSAQADGRRLRVSVPPPQILGVEQVSFDVLALENGIWNRVSPSDVESEVRGLLAMAREKAQQAGIEQEAVGALNKRLSDRLAPTFDVEMRVQSPARPAQVLESPRS